VLDVGKQTEVPPQDVAVDDGDVSSPSLSATVPHVGNNNIHVAALQLLFVDLICLFEVVPESLEHQMSQEDLLAEGGHDHALFFLIYVFVDYHSSLFTELVPLRALVLKNSSAEVFILLSHLLHQVQILAIIFAEHRSFETM
jgi:hypothetical protein